MYTITSICTYGCLSHIVIAVVYEDMNETAGYTFMLAMELHCWMSGLRCLCFRYIASCGASSFFLLVCYVLVWLFGLLDLFCTVCVYVYSALQLVY